MFGSTKKSGRSEYEDIETILGKNTTFKGVVGGEGNIRIDGKMEGTIETHGDVIVGSQGEVIAEVKASNLVISGRVKGNVELSDKLEILETGQLVGDVKAAVLSIAEGAIFKGRSEMGRDEKVNLSDQNNAKQKEK